MEFALFRCCPTATLLKQYEMSSEAILTGLGVAFKEIKEFNCCGYPLKNINFKAYALSSARNLALAGKKEVDILAFCNCCFNTLKQVQHYLNDDANLLSGINESLAKEGLAYDPDVRVMHLLEVLHRDIGLPAIKEKIINPLQGLKIGTQYGCHILRPSEVVGFDNPTSPSIFDDLVEVTGAESVDWTNKLECCGSPMWGIDDELAMDLTGKKIDNAREAGADYVCSACVFCQLQFDRVQKMMLEKRNGQPPLPALIYTQLLGIGMGIDSADLGIELNELDATGITEFVS